MDRGHARRFPMMLTHSPRGHRRVQTFLQPNDRMIYRADVAPFSKFALVILAAAPSACRNPVTSVPNKTPGLPGFAGVDSRGSPELITLM